ncbi:MAG: GAF domain-containing protein, partial [Clostridiales bacterium]
MKHRAELAVLLTSIDELLTKWGAGDFDQRILSWISHFVHGVDAAIFYCYQQNNQTLVVAESCGFEREIKELFSLQIGEGLCGQVFATGQGRLINDLRQIEDLAEEMNSLMDIIHLDEGSNAALPTSMIAVPVCIDQPKWGVLLLISFSLHLGFEQSDYEVGVFAARLLARHLDWLDKQKRLGQLQQDIKRLEDVIIYDDNKGAKNRLVERSLLDHFLRGCDFADIMTIAEQNFLFPLALYNLFLEKISGTETSSNKQLPDNILDLQVMQELIYWKTPRSAMVQGEILHLYPVLCGETLRGFIACWTPNKEFTDVQSDLLEIICRAAACIWVKMT